MDNILKLPFIQTQHVIVNMDTYPQYCSRNIITFVEEEENGKRDEAILEIVHQWGYEDYFITCKS